MNGQRLKVFTFRPKEIDAPDLERCVRALRWLYRYSPGSFRALNRLTIDAYERLSSNRSESI
jgi:hypothetical protein